MTATARDESLAGVVGAAPKDVRKHTLSDSAKLSPVVHFELAAIKRPIPKSVRVAKLFESKSWYIPPPIPAYVPPPQPKAPPLQFVFVGRMVDGNEVTVFLSRNDQQYAAKEKDVLDGIYRIDKIGEGEAVFTYLPTNAQQTLSFNTTTAANSLISATALKTAMRPVVTSLQPYSN
jgi:hypothetical protein